MLNKISTFAFFLFIQPTRTVQQEAQLTGKQEKAGTRERKIYKGP